MDRADDGADTTPRAATAAEAATDEFGLHYRGFIDGGVDGDAPWSLYYDRDSKPIPYSVWAALFEFGDARRGQVSYRIVRKSYLPGDVEVSTVWLGLDHSIGLGRPEIFESLVFTHHEPIEVEVPESRYGPAWTYTKHSIAGHMERYSTEEEAIAGHRRIVRALREGQPLRSD